MRIAIYSNVHNARQGGGVLYIASLAAALAQSNAVELFFSGEIEQSELEQVLPVPLCGVRIGPVAASPRVPLFSEIKGLLTRTSYDRIVVQSTWIPRLKHARNTMLVCEFPLQKTLRLSERSRLRAVRTIIANSSFTADWIERRWGRKAEVLHPAIFPIVPLQKEPWILSVGRLLDGPRSKCQLEMIQMFRELLESGLRGWQLHIAGMVQDEDYSRRVRDMANGLPVVLHFNISRTELEELYGRASIFWHATGIQADPDTEPEYMEHFGIATAEAMTAGAVPLVINRGGQPEILGGSDCGILWNTFAECKAATWTLIHDQARLAQMSQRAVERANAFLFPSFVRRVTDIFEGRN